MRDKPYYLRPEPIVIGDIDEGNGDVFYVVMMAPKDTLNDKGEVIGTTMGGPIFYADLESNAEELVAILNEREAQNDANG